MNKPYQLILLRLLLAVLVVLALPVSHTYWGQTYPGDGQQAFGFIVIFAVVGAIAAALFLGLGSLGQFLLRRQALRYTVIADVALFLIFAGMLVWGGVTAKYNDAKPKPAAALTTSDAGRGLPCVS